MKNKSKIYSYYKICFISGLFLSLISLELNAQNRILELEKELVRMSIDIPELNDKVDISVNGVSVQELLRGIANNVKINLTVDPSIDVKVVNNFSQVRVIDVLLYLCKEHKLDISRTGNIISIIRYTEPPKEIPKAVRKKINVSYDPAYNIISMDVSNDSLLSVVKEIINQSGVNITLSPGLNNQMVTGYLKDSPFNQGLSSFAYSNNLKFSQIDDNFYLFEKADQKEQLEEIKGEKSDKKSISGRKGEDVMIEIPEDRIISVDSISVFAEKRPIIELLNEVTMSTGVGYFILSPIQGEASLNIQNVNFEQFLIYLFQGTNYTFKKHNNVYLIGDRKLEDLKCVKLVQLQYRTIENIKELIPADLVQKVSVYEFTEQNSVLLSGSMVDIETVESFIREIDKIVPVILIEVIIIDHSKKYGMQTGIKAGMSDDLNTVKSSGTIAPSVDINIGTESINNLLNSINGWGFVNLGKVTPRFYMNIKALEDNNLIKIRSTPKLATLNGHEASLVSGETKYYREESNAYYGSQIPQLEKAFQWKAINADLTINIKPIVSGNDQVTLEIEVQQSQFTPREYELAPPGSVTRTFKSLIRVKNEEMVLLGGLDRNTSSETSQGLPLLARIPVIKWFFSSRSRSNEDAKLSIFIKPTIIY